MSSLAHPSRKKQRETGRFRLRGLAPIATCRKHRVQNTLHPVTHGVSSHRIASCRSLCGRRLHVPVFLVVRVVFAELGYSSTCSVDSITIFLPSFKIIISEEASCVIETCPARKHASPATSRKPTDPRHDRRYAATDRGSCRYRLGYGEGKKSSYIQRASRTSFLSGDTSFRMAVHGPIFDTLISSSCRHWNGAVIA